MKKIRILTPNHTTPNVVTNNTIFFKSVLYELRKKLKVQIIWVVYLPEKLDEISIENENEKILDIHNFNNYVEILKNEKPDLVYADATYSLIDFAISTAAKSLGIPVLSKIYNRSDGAKNQKTNIKFLTSQFFEESHPTDQKQIKKQFMRRGRFFFYKFKFMIQTLNASKYGKIQSFFTGLRILTYFLNIGKHEGYPEFANTLHWLESENRFKKLLELGYDKKSLIITGNPMYDSVLKKIKNIKSEQKLNHKPIILFLPMPYYEHGMWTKKQNEGIFKEIVKKINESNNFILKIKLHPSSQQLSEYEQMLKEINANVEIIQKGDAIEHIIGSEIIISYPTNSTALIFALLCEKPIILCNFSNLDTSSILKRDLAVECKDLEKLNYIINNVLEKNPISEEKIKQFITEFFYKPDGNAGQRVSDAIIKLIEKKSHHS
jgi:hypothetical protein